MSAVIQVENLGKKYVLRHQQGERYSMLRDVLAQKAKSGLRKLAGGRSGAPSPAREEFWALKDVSFNIDQGDRVGIIGRNGAGKSTLLKVLSRITAPTTGRLSIRGRVSSLLEVGTGFHPELTGRENIYLNGAILGMSRTEIARKFDEIVAFAEVEKFLDTPVKRYSSGMYVRLAFAVAAHLEPEILIVDEVLAVGDAQFQKKCLGKMQDIGKEGRTVLFVSHSTASVANLCLKCLLLHDGAVLYSGPTEDALARYSGLASRESGRAEDMRAFRPSWASPLISQAQILSSTGEAESQFPMGSDLMIEMSFSAGDDKPLKAPVMGVTIHHETLGPVGGVNMRMMDFGTQSGGPYESATMRCHLKRLTLLPGRYTVELWLSDGSKDLDTLDRYLSFDVEETDVYGTGRPPFRNLGVIFLEPTWQISHGVAGERAA